MGYLDNKNEESIHNQLLETIKTKLLSGFNDGYHRRVESVEAINVNFEIDEAKSDRDKVTIKSVNASARVWVKVQNHDAFAIKNLQLRMYKSIEFPFDENVKEYKIANVDEIELTDITPL